MKAIAFRRNLVIAFTILLVGAFVLLSTGWANLNDDLVGYWSFDEGSGGTAYDYSGNNNHGTIYGATWTTGISGGALYFVEENDYVSISPLLTTESTGTISFVGQAFLPLAGCLTNPSLST